MEGTVSGRAELLRFIDAAKQQGVADATLTGILKASGWPDVDIYAAMREHVERSTGLTVPVKRGLAGGARDAFLYLLSFGTLGAWTVALGSLFFMAIDRIWPDAVMLGWPGDLRHGTARDIASLLVALPVYLLTTRTLARLLEEDPDSAESPIRKWLTYLALLIAAGVVIGDLITFLAYLLRGEITARFVAKVLVVLILAGGVFTYYVSSLRGRARNSGFASLAIALALLGLTAGFSFLGSPANQRGLEADVLRVDHLRALAHELAARGGTPPPAIVHLRSRRTDPVTGTPYEYRVLDGGRYELCAWFSAESRDGFWGHGSGRQCFVLDISKPAP